MAGLVNLFLFLLVCTVTQAKHGHDFSYDEQDHNGPSHWGRGTQCGSTIRQSPIDIRTDGVIRNKLFTAGLTCTNAPTTWSSKLRNNGHTISGVVSPGCSSKVQNLPEFGCGLFDLSSYHFHFSSDNTHGSEHTMDGKAFPAEMHFVHMNTKYSTLEEASNHADGLMVVGAFFELSEVADPDISLILDEAKLLEKTSAEMRSVSFDLLRLLNSMERLYTYSGSLTTPPCSEIVQWIVMETKIPITENQLNILRLLKTGARKRSPPISKFGNCRPIQPLNGRTIYSNF